MQPIEEPLLESAPLAWRLAPQLCRKEPATGENCAWYHGIWQALRLMGLASSAAQRAAFYHDSLDAAPAASRILISGTADYAMLAVVVAWLEKRGVRPEITVIDVCETPLHLSRWYAERKDRKIETVCTDVLDYRPGKTFDVICTDGFFSRIHTSRRPALVARWRELLGPGGRTITTNRVHPGSGSEKTGFSPARAQRFRDDVLRAVTDKPDIAGIDPRELTRGADRYARLHDTYPLASSDEVRGMFEAGGFRIEALSEVGRAGRQRDDTNEASPRKKPVMQMHLVAARV